MNSYRIYVCHIPVALPPSSAEEMYMMLYIMPICVCILPNNTHNYININSDTSAIKHQKFLPSCAFLSQLSVDFLACFSLVQCIYIPYANSSVSDLPVL